MKNVNNAGESPTIAMSFEEPHREHKPSVGQYCTVRNTTCRIVKVLPLGTMDVVSLCGNYAWRVSGLNFGGR